MTSMTAILLVALCLSSVQETKVTQPQKWANRPGPSDKGQRKKIHVLSFWQFCRQGRHKIKVAQYLLKCCTMNFIKLDWAHWLRSNFVAFQLSSVHGEQQTQLDNTSVGFIKNPEKSIDKDIRPNQEVEECRIQCIEWSTFSLAYSELTLNFPWKNADTCSSLWWKIFFSDIRR